MTFVIFVRFPTEFRLNSVSFLCFCEGGRWHPTRGRRVPPRARTHAKSDEFRVISEFRVIFVWIPCEFGAIPAYFPRNFCDFPRFSCDFRENSVRIPHNFCVFPWFSWFLCDFHAKIVRIPCDFRANSVWIHGIPWEFTEFRVNPMRFPRIFRVISVIFHDLRDFRAIFVRIPCNFCVFPWFSWFLCGFRVISVWIPCEFRVNSVWIHGIPSEFRVNSMRVPRIFRVIYVIFHDFCDFRAISDRIPFEFRVISVLFRDFREFRVNSRNSVWIRCDFRVISVIFEIFVRFPTEFRVIFVFFRNFRDFCAISMRVPGEFRVNSV